MSYLFGSTGVHGLGEPAARPRVVLIPGIMGSRLRDTSTSRVLWGDNAMLTPGNVPNLLRDLAQGNGVDVPGNVIADGFTRHVFPVASAASLAALLSGSLLLRYALRRSGLRDIVIDPYGDALKRFRTEFGADNVLAFPYDWRLANEHNAALLKRAIDRKWADTLQDRARPLTLVGHSMGGLVARYYTERLGGSSVVRNLVTVGTPHIGAPDALLVPNNLPALARHLAPLDYAAILSPALGAAIPLLQMFVNVFLKTLQTAVLHFNSLYQLLPDFPFVSPASAPGTTETLAVTYDLFKRAVCPTPPSIPSRLICSTPIADLRRFNTFLGNNLRSLPTGVGYYSFVSFPHQTTVAARRLANGTPEGVAATCGDGTVPARSAMLPIATNVRNRFIAPAVMHSDLLRDPLILLSCVNIIRGHPQIAVAGITEVVPACLPATARITQVTPPRVRQPHQIAIG